MPEPTEENNTLPPLVDPTSTPTLAIPVVPTVVPTPLPPVTTTPTIPSEPSSPKKSKKGLLMVTLIGIFALVILGVLVFFVVNKPKEEVSKTPSPTPTVIIKTLVIEVDGLTSGQVVNTKAVAIKGNTNVPSTVSITGGTEEVVVDSTGTFSTEVSLNNGENVLVFTAVDKDENQKVLTLNLFYTDEVLQ